jgi:hypothetical protein
MHEEQHGEEKRQRIYNEVRRAMDERRRRGEPVTSLEWMQEYTRLYDSELAPERESGSCFCCFMLLLIVYVLYHLVRP